MKACRSILIALVALFAGLAVTANAANSVKDDLKISYPTTDKRHYADPKVVNFVRPGLVVDTGPEDVTIGDDGTISIMFTVTDDRGLALDLDGIETPGPISLRFIIGFTTDAGKYTSYVNRTQTSPITGESAVQPTAERDGAIEQVADGAYVYTFTTTLPDNYNANATHTIAGQFERDLSEFDLGEYVANPIVHFVPAGGDPLVRDIVRTETCNNCHDPLAIHGGGRREIEYCVMCHTEGVIDPDTGNTVDLGIMTHKIHMGENLPSVEAGTPYQIIGFRQSVHDYSHVVYPQPVNGCTSCHTDDVSQATAWFDRPTREICGSCHDDVDFVTGENHVGGPAISDNFCANCHFPEGELEFDSSIIGAHIVEQDSTQLPGLAVEVLEVTNGLAGQSPTVRFAVADGAGAPVTDLANLNRLRLTIVGPNSDYEFRAQEDALGAMPTGVDGEYSYTFEATMPDLAEGSYSIGVEGRNVVTLNPGTTDEIEGVRDPLDSVVFPFAVTDSEAMARRVVVDDALCENCHGNLLFHGENRTNGTEYCQTCHNPTADDSDVRPPEVNPPQTIDFRFMIHRIHTGEELLADYTVYGFRGSLHNYNEVLYPGDLRNCESCHVNDGQQVPSGGTLSVLATDNDFYSPIPPDSAACLGCHDSLAAAAHTAVNTAPFGESCGACHGEGKEFSVDRVHARID